ncbi:MAG: hypothetical protein Q6373_026000, partial [Candidatus Sigynarchaeota archaeon]
GAYRTHDSNRGSGQTSGNLVPVLSIGLHALGMGDFLVSVDIVKRWAETGHDIVHDVTRSSTFTFPVEEYPGVVELPGLVAITAGSDPSTGRQWFDVTYNVSRAFYDDWLRVLQLPAGSALPLELFVQREGWDVEAMDVDLAHGFATARFDVAMNETEQFKVVTATLPATTTRSSRAAWIGYETDGNRTWGGAPAVTMTYADVSYVAEQERWLLQYTGGRLGRIMPHTGPFGDMGYILYPATPAMPTFYRSTEGEANAIRNPDGSIAVHDWALGRQEMAYQADLGITSLVTTFATLYAPKMQQGLFGIFQGADWRIWLVGVVETAVQAAAAAVAAKALTGVKEAHAVVEKGSTEVVKVEVTRRFGQAWSAARQALVFSWKQLAKDLLLEMARSILDEVIKEQLVSETAKLLGMPDAAAEELGEYFFFGGEVWQNRQEAKAAMQASASELARCQARAATNAIAKVSDQIEASAQKAQLETASEVAAAKADIAAIKAVAREKAIVLAAHRGAMAMRGFARSVEQGCTAAFLAESDAALANVDVTTWGFDIEQFLPATSKSQYARGCVHALVEAMRAVAEFNKHAAEGDTISPQELLDSPAMKALFQCPAGNYMGLVVKEKGDRLWSWEMICEKFTTIDERFFSFLQNAESITFFDPSGKPARAGRGGGPTITEARNLARSALKKAKELWRESAKANKPFSATFNKQTYTDYKSLSRAVADYIEWFAKLEPHQRNDAIGALQGLVKTWNAACQRIAIAQLPGAADAALTAAQALAASAGQAFSATFQGQVYTTFEALREAVEQAVQLRLHPDPLLDSAVLFGLRDELAALQAACEARLAGTAPPAGQPARARAPAAAQGSKTAPLHPGWVEVAPRQAEAAEAAVASKAAEPASVPESPVAAEAKKVALGMQANHVSWLRNQWNMEHPNKQNKGNIARAALYSRQDSQFTGEYIAGSHDVQGFIKQHHGTCTVSDTLGTTQFGLRGRYRDAEIKVFMDVYQRLKGKAGQEFDLFLTTERDACGSCLLAAAALRRTLARDGVTLNIHVQSLHRGGEMMWLGGGAQRYDIASAYYAGNEASLKADVDRILDAAAGGDSAWLGSYKTDDAGIRKYDNGFGWLFDIGNIDLARRVAAIFEYLETGRCAYQGWRYP